MEGMVNKIGICEWSLPVDGPCACMLAEALGIDGIQLDVGPAERGFPMARAVVQDAYLDAAASTGVVFPSMATRVTDYFSMFASVDREESEVVRKGIHMAVDACSALEIPVLMIPTFVKSEIRTDSQLVEAVETFKWACDRAGPRGITVAAENTLSVDQTLRFFEQIGRPNLKLYFDTQNYHLNKGYDTPAMLDALMPYVCEIHVKDGQEGQLSGALLGAGATRFHDSVAVMRKHGYKGWIVSENYYDREPLCAADQDPVALITEDLRTLKAALGPQRATKR